jgi:ABC-2 type transport system permease protein
MKKTSSKHSGLYWAFSDTFVLIGRSLKHIFKNLDQLLSLFIQPIMFMLLFRYVFGGAIKTDGVTYVNYLVPGILVQTVAFGALTTSLGVATDIKRGIVDRFKSLPMVSSAVMTGHVVADLVRNSISSVIMILVALLVGFRPVASVMDWLAIWAILLLFTFAISWISAIMGLLAKSVEAVQWLGFLAIFPLTFASSAFAPTESMPTILKIFAENQPVTLVINALRALMVGTPTNNYALLSAIWCSAIIVICIPLAAHLFRKQGSK